jgi:hypothetical protein
MFLRFGSDEGKETTKNSNVCLKNDCSARFKGGILENNFLLVEL